MLLARVYKFTITDRNSRVDDLIARQASKGVAAKTGIHGSLMAMFDAALFKAWPSAKGAGVTSSCVVKCPNYNYGDFQCNAAMSLYRALKVGREALSGDPELPALTAPPPDFFWCVRYCSCGPIISHHQPHAVLLHWRMVALHNAGVVRIFFWTR